MNNKDLAIRLAQAAYERERNGLSMYDLLEGVLDLYIALEEHEEHTLRGQLDLLYTLCVKMLRFRGAYVSTNHIETYEK